MRSIESQSNKQRETERETQRETQKDRERQRGESESQAGRRAGAQAGRQVVPPFEPPPPIEAVTDDCKPLTKHATAAHRENQIQYQASTPQRSSEANGDQEQSTKPTAETPHKHTHTHSSSSGVKHRDQLSQLHKTIPCRDVRTFTALS